MEKKELIEAMAQILDSKLIPMYRKIDRVENKWNAWIKTGSSGVQV